MAELSAFIGIEAIPAVAQMTAGGMAWRLSDGLLAAS